MIDGIDHVLLTGHSLRWDEALDGDRFSVDDPFGNRIEILAAVHSGAWHLREQPGELEAGPD